MAVKTVVNTIWRGCGKISSVGEAIELLSPQSSNSANAVGKTFLKYLREEPPNVPTTTHRSYTHEVLTPWYRGVINKDYSLVPSFQRPIYKAKENSVKKVSHILDETQGTTHIVSIYPELRTMTCFDALATLQHYDFPTRLLDWTFNPLFSLLFACEDPKVEGLGKETDGELFVLNPLKLNYYTCARWGTINTEHPESIMRLRLVMCNDYQSYSSQKKFNDPSDKFFASQIGFDHQKYLREKRASNINKWSMGKSLATPVAVYPVRYNQRLKIQEGAFTLHGGKVYPSEIQADDSLRLPRPMTIEDVQEAAFSYEALRNEATKCDAIFIASFIIPKEKKEEICKELKQMGITYGKLLPELDCVARHTKALWMRPSEKTFKTNTVPPHSNKKESDKCTEKQEHEINKWLKAVKNNNLEQRTIEDSLIKNGAYRLLGMRPMVGSTVFFEMAALGRHEMMADVLKLCKKAIDDGTLSKSVFSKIINNPNHLGWTPLYGAILYGHPKCALALIEAGASRKIEGNDLQNSMLSILVRHEGLDKDLTVKDLIEKVSYKLNSNASKNPEAPNPTAGSMSYDSLNPTEATVFGRSPIHYACTVGAIHAVKALIPYHKTLNVYQKDSMANTPLQLACIWGYSEIVQELIEQAESEKLDLDINYRTPYGKSALDFALAATTLRKGTSYLDNPFFTIVQQLYLNHAEVMNINGFNDTNFRKILILTREIIIIRDLKIAGTTDDNLETIKELLDEDQTSITKSAEKAISAAKELQAHLVEPKPQKNIFYNDLYKIAQDVLSLFEPEQTTEANKIKDEIFNYKLKKVLADAKTLIHLSEGFKNNSIFISTKEERCIKELISELSSILFVKNKYLECDNCGLTILSHLVRLNDEKIIDKIHLINPAAVNQGAKVNGWSNPLSEACFFGSNLAVNKLIELGAEIGEKLPLDHSTTSSRSPLMISVWGFRPDILNALISKLEEKQIPKDALLKTLNIKDEQAHNLLSMAICNYGIFTTLLRSNPVRNHENQIENHWSKQLPVDLKKIVELLLNKEVNLKDTYPGIFHNENTILHLATAYGVPREVFDMLLSKLKNDKERIELLEQRNGIGETLMHTAADYGREDYLQMFQESPLIRDKAPKTYDGRTPDDYFFSIVQMKKNKNQHD